MTTFTCSRIRIKSKSDLKCPNDGDFKAITKRPHTFRLFSQLSDCRARVWLHVDVVRVCMIGFTRAHNLGRYPGGWYRCRNRPGQWGMLGRREGQCPSYCRKEGTNVPEAQKRSSSQWVFIFKVHQSGWPRKWSVVGAEAGWKEDVPVVWASAACTTEFTGKPILRI